MPPTMTAAERAAAAVEAGDYPWHYEDRDEVRERHWLHWRRAELWDD
jgi:hypothetical protein